MLGEVGSDVPICWQSSIGRGLPAIRRSGTSPVPKIYIFSSMPKNGWIHDKGCHRPILPSIVQKRIYAICGCHVPLAEG
jgi:hypothetical protein